MGWRAKQRGGGLSRCSARNRLAGFGLKEGLEPESWRWSLVAVVGAQEEWARVREGGAVNYATGQEGRASYSVLQKEKFN